jgi:hypothetical protein
MENRDDLYSHFQREDDVRLRDPLAAHVYYISRGRRE